MQLTPEERKRLREIYKESGLKPVSNPQTISGIFQKCLPAQIYGLYEIRENKMIYVVTVRNIEKNDVGTCSWHRTEAGAMARAKELQNIHDEEYERFLEYKIMALPLED